WVIHVTQHPGKLERAGVDVHDVATGMHDADRTVRRDAVEIVSRHAAVVEVDRVERPPGERLLGIGELCGGLGQTRDDRIDRFESAPGLAVRISAIEKAAVYEAPLHALADMAVSFNQARHQDLVGKRRIKLMVAPSFELVERTDTEDASVSHGDMGRKRSARI